MTNNEIKTFMHEHGVSWALDSDKAGGRLHVCATGAENAGVVVLMYIPDDIVLHRAKRIMADRKEELKHLVHSINARLMCCKLAIDIDALKTIEDVDQHTTMLNILYDALIGAN